jgi:general secretion pathway protein K
MVDKILMKQQGVALITALLVVALVTTLSVAWMTRQALVIRRTANLLHHDQAYFYSLGGEAWARLLLQQDDLTVDTLKENWAMRLPVMPIEGGTLQGELNDLQGRFNLNNLLTDSGEVSQADVARLERLLLALEVSPILVQTIVDWLDRDATPQLPNGAEDTFYLGQKPSYRAANRLMVDSNELRAVAGITPEIFETLRPYITALPKRTLLNVNTASLPLLRTVAPEVTQAEAETLITLRETEPFVSVQAFAKQDALAGHRVEMENLSVSSQYFLYLGEAHIDRGSARLQSVLQREGNRVTVLARSQE